MEETIEIRTSNRERKLIDLKSIIKQVYHEAVNHELSSDNVTYITQLLIKRIDETLLFGLKQPQHGYWKILRKILHPDSLNSLNNIAGFGQPGCDKERTWIALSLLEDALVSYINCFVAENLEKVYEDWSVVRHNDACNAFLSLLSGIESVTFQYHLLDALALPINCRLTPRLSLVPLPWSPPPSLTDSGVQLDHSDDYLNGNLPVGAEVNGAVIMRRKPKPTLRHVSFHEDSLAKSPSQRKLRWDAESSRYSWAGEELDALRLPGLRGCRGERGAPEGEEAPTSTPDLRSVPVTVAPSRRYRRLSTRKYRYDRQQLVAFTQNLDAEVGRHRRSRSMHELHLPDKLAVKLGVRGVRYWAYKLWGGKVVVITAERLILLHKDLTSTQLGLPQIEQVVVLPHGHELQILTRKQTHILTCGDRILSHEIVTRLAYQLHVAVLQVCFRVLHPSDMCHVKKELVNQRIVSWEDDICYMGLVRLPAKENTQALHSVEKHGSVMCLTSTSQAWRPANLTLRGGSLNISGEARSPIASVNLITSCLACERSIFADRPHTFTITLKDSVETEDGLYEQLAKNSSGSYSDKSTLRKWINRKSGAAVSDWVSRALGNSPTTPTTAIHIAVADEYLISDWLQAILDVFCQGNRVDVSDGEATEATFLITQTMVVLLSHSTHSGDSGFRMLGSALIHDITSFCVGSHSNDAYCIIELECQEASSSTSDWVLHFGSRAELNQARTILEEKWRLSDLFPLDTITDSKCERTQDCLTREWFA